MTSPTAQSAILVFDVNETLSDMSPLADRFADLGVDGRLAELWFTTLLRDGFALTSAGASRPFSELAEAGLLAMLADAALDRPLDAAIAYVMDAFGALTVHADVPEGIAALADAGHRLVTLSNGSASVADVLLRGCGLRGRFEACLSVEDAGVWKPARAAYLHAATTCGVEPAQMMMVAVHPWDIDGASRAGLRTAWIDRRGRPYPGYFIAPDLRAGTLAELAERLGDRPDEPPA